MCEWLQGYKDTDLASLNNETDNNDTVRPTSLSNFNIFPENLLYFQKLTICKKNVVVLTKKRLFLNVFSKKNKKNCLYLSQYVRSTEAYLNRIAFLGNNLSQGTKGYKNAEWKSVNVAKINIRMTHTDILNRNSFCARIIILYTESTNCRIWHSSQPWLILIISHLLFILTFLFNMLYCAILWHLTFKLCADNKNTRKLRKAV